MRRRGELEVVDDLVKTFFESGSAKVDEWTDGQIHQTEVCEKLLAVDWYQLFHGLEFHDHSLIHN